MTINNLSEMSTTPGSNQDFSGTSILGTGLISTADDSFRNLASFLAKFYDDFGAVNTVAGTGDAITVTTPTTYTALATGMRIAFIAGAANTTATTLNLDAIGAKAVRKISGGTDVALIAKDILAGVRYELIYSSAANGAAGAWILVNPFLQIINGSAVDGSTYLTLTNNNTNQFLKMGINANVGEIGWDNADTMQFGQWDDTDDTSLAAAFSVDVDRNFFVGKIADDITTTGHELLASGTAYHTRDGGTVLQLNRLSSDGTLVDFRQASTSEGTISVSGTTVTYGSFCGAHWSQLADGSQPAIMRGTVLESIDKMCVWPDEENDQLAGFKISDTPSSPAVYGVFVTWDVENDAASIASLGAFLIRVAAGASVKRGDLLESAGNGCAKVQADDLFRASTVAKVTSNHVVETYGDGSYLVPCTLHCG